MPSATHHPHNCSGQLLYTNPTDPTWVALPRAPWARFGNILLLDAFALQAYFMLPVLRLWGQFTTNQLDTMAPKGGLEALDQFAADIAEALCPSSSLIHGETDSADGAEPIGRAMRKRLFPQPDRGHASALCFLCLLAKLRAEGMNDKLQARWPQ